MLPPNFAFMQKRCSPPSDRADRAVGTLLGIVLALPVCFFASTKPIALCLGVPRATQVLNVMRGINEIILALIFAVGLTVPSPGSWPSRCTAPACWASSWVLKR